MTLAVSPLSAAAAGLPISDGLYVSKPQFCEDFRRGEVELFEFEVSEGGNAFSYPESFCVVAEVKAVREARYRVIGDCDEAGEIWQSAFFLDVLGDSQIAIDGNVHQLCVRDTGDESVDAREVLDEWMTWNERCRGGSGDDPETLSACDKRSEVARTLEEMSLCYGRETESGADFQWHKCGPGSIHHSE